MAVKHKDAVWSVAEAKAKFSEVIERAIHEGPQEITRNGKDAVVIVAKDTWSKKPKPERTALEMFQSIELDNELLDELDLERIRFPVRAVDL